jgi:hypothetical protein
MQLVDFEVSISLKNCVNWYMIRIIRVSLSDTNFIITQRQQKRVRTV